MGHPNNRCKNPTCEREYHYCTSCGIDRAAELGFCSDRCMGEYLEEMDDVPLIIEALLNEYLYAIPNMGRIISKYEDEIKDQLYIEVIKRNTYEARKD